MFLFGNDGKPVLPLEVSHAIIGLLEGGLLSIRSAATEGDAILCEIESNHLHNLPALLKHQATELLEFYWNVEKAEYQRQVSEKHCWQFLNHWKVIRQFLDDVEKSRAIERR